MKTKNNYTAITTAKTSNAPVLADPSIQDLFIQDAPNALAPDFIYSPIKQKSYKDKKRQNYSKSEQYGDYHDDDDEYVIVVQQTVHETGLKNKSGDILTTKIWGYGEKGLDHTDIKVTWPGKTFEVSSNKKTTVKWINDLKDAKDRPLGHLLPIDDSLRWCYALPDKNRNITIDGVPLVPHLHGGHSSPEADGNPEYFEGVTENSRGPRFVSNQYHYDNSQQACSLWYHDNALGITRLNVYSGLAGFYIIRDEHDTGKHDNPLGLPAKPYELAYCIQDRMFRENGELFYPAFRDDPAWKDFIDDEEANPPHPDGPSALAEFFGDHILVNGKLWPKASVESRHYRIRLLNASDSRFMRLQLRSVAAGETDLNHAGAPLTFTVIGADQGLLPKAVEVTSIDFMPGERLDIVVDFSNIEMNSRIIVENILGDDPFTGEVPNSLNPDRRTDRIMAFDICLPLNSETYGHFDGHEEEHSEIVDRFNTQALNNKLKGLYPTIPESIDNFRKLALYEGKDEFGRLMSMLGTAEPVIDTDGNTVNGSMVWHTAITENPKLDDTEIWDIYNATGDAHPIHVHLVHFNIISRKKFNIDEPGVLIQQEIKTPGDQTGIGFRLENVEILPLPANSVLASEKGPKDMVLCYPGEVTRIKMKFDRAGRYVWHCHILSHEDHDMMRAFHVGKIPKKIKQ